MQDLNDMLLFAEVADQGSFAGAGRTLALPKSTLSRRVADLEARLGVRLLHRTTRKLALTEAGEAYHRHCVALREQAQAAEEAVAAFHDEPRGTIRMAVPVTLAQIGIGHLVPQFLLKHPHVRIDMQVTNRVVDLVQEGFDLALRVRPSVDDSGSLVVKHLGQTRGVLVASPALLERLGPPASVADLARLPTVAMSMADGRASWVLEGPHGRREAFEHRPVYAADDLWMLKYAVVAGVGFSILADFICARERREGALVEVLPGWGPPVGVMHAVFPSRRGMVPAVRRFLDFLGEHARGEELGASCPA
jgi:DNA-binding transcriptional LysR family regulator